MDRLRPAHRRLLLWLSVTAAITGCHATTTPSVDHRPPLERLQGPSVPPLVVAPLLDRRPLVEREGSTADLHVLVPLVALWHYQVRGNVVTADPVTPGEPPATASSDGAPPPVHTRIARQVRDLLGSYLERTGRYSGVVAEAPPAAGPHLRLETELVHLYGSHYVAATGTFFLVATRSSTASGSQSSTSTFGPHALVVLAHRLFLVEPDRAGGQKERLIWQGHVRGFSDGPDGSDAASSQLVAATRQALTRSTLAITSAAENAGVGGSEEEHLARLAQVHAGGPHAFLLARTLGDGDRLEFHPLRCPDGTAHGPAFAAAPHLTPMSRPGDWVLSRMRPDGSTMSGAEYRALARHLARHFDLRQLDDVTQYHFVGRRPEPPAVAPAPPSRRGRARARTARRPVVDRTLVLLQVR